MLKSHVNFTILTYCTIIQSSKFCDKCNVEIKKKNLNKSKVYFHWEIVFFLFCKPILITEKSDFIRIHKKKLCEDLSKYYTD